MFSSIGLKVRCSVFGESHGEAIGCVLEGLPSGEKIDMNEIMIQMKRRAPGRDMTATQRKESDTPRILSGLLEGVTTGAPLTMIIENENTRSADYKNIENLPRPGHADYTGYVRYKGFNDVRGGGHFSGRLTAPLVFAGAVCKQVLKRRGISVGGHIYEINGVYDKEFVPAEVSSEELENLSLKPFSLINSYVESDMRTAVEKARLSADSVGGQIEIAATGIPAGVGSPMFRTIEGRLAAAIFGIPAIKGIEFGKGFAFSKMLGSQANDPMEIKEGKVVTKTNHNGGILGGITNGMPIVFKVVVKPTSSIGSEQDTVDLDKMENAKLIIKGRHDPCIVPRALPVVEAVAALTLLDILETE